MSENDRRANWADAALQAFMQVTGCDGGDAVSDLLADMMHWCDQRGEDFQAELDRATDHYQIEVEEAKEAML